MPGRGPADARCIREKTLRVPWGRGPEAGPARPWTWISLAPTSWGATAPFPSSHSTSTKNAHHT
eukprot:3343782-Pyramimonas_sp.AAC.1